MEPIAISSGAALIRPIGSPQGDMSAALQEGRILTGQVLERSEENRTLATRNAALEAEVLNLKQGLAAAEERARTELGMIADGETFYHVTFYRPSATEEP